MKVPAKVHWTSAQSNVLVSSFLLPVIEVSKGDKSKCHRPAVTVTRPLRSPHDGLLFACVLVIPADGLSVAREILGS